MFAGGLPTCTLQRQLRLTAANNGKTFSRGMVSFTTTKLPPAFQATYTYFGQLQKIRLKASTLHVVFVAAEFLADWSRGIYVTAKLILSLQNYLPFLQVQMYRFYFKVHVVYSRKQESAATNAKISFESRPALCLQMKTRNCCCKCKDFASKCTAFLAKDTNLWLQKCSLQRRNCGGDPQWCFRT